VNEKPTPNEVFTNNNITKAKHEEVCKEEVTNENTYKAWTPLQPQSYNT
jgi:hypothetical protein